MWRMLKKLFEAVAVGGISPRSWKAKSESGPGSELLQSPRVPETKPAVTVRTRRWWKPGSCPVCDTLPYMNDGHDSGNG